MTKALVFSEYSEFFFAGEVVADVAVEEPGLPGRFGILDQQGDGDGDPTTATEDVASLLPSLLSSSPCNTSKVEDRDLAELVSKTFAETICGVAVDEPAVRYEADHSFVADAVGGESDGSDVAVVETVLVGCGGGCRVGFLDPLVEVRVLQVLVVVVTRSLSHGVGRVSDNDPDRELFLSFDSFVIFGEAFHAGENTWSIT